MATALTIAHLSDVHLGPIRGFNARQWNAKRLIGYWNWHRNRRDIHRRDVLDCLVADIHSQAPDHIVVTGDLANIGLPQEHVDALAWLQSLGLPEHVTVIPGNHDIYAALGSDPGTQRWTAYMSSDGAGVLHLDDNGAEFPFVRVRKGVALIGLNSAVPTPPFVASGLIGAAQLAQLGRVLDRTGRAGLFRLVLVHHPPLPKQAAPLRALRDAAALRDVLQRHGAELVIHGHNHFNTLALQPTANGGLIPVVGVASGSQARVHRREPLARYNLYRIEGPPWSVLLIGRGLAEPGGSIVELERRMLTGP